MKRLARYLKGRPRLVLEYPLQESCSFFDVLVDTDHAGCLRTRKTTEEHRSSVYTQSRHGAAHKASSH
eukprot:8083886-Pyramimonas_sp.AAC.1